MHQAEPDPYARLTLTQLAEALGVTIRTLHRWRQEGAPLGQGLAAIRAWRLRKPRKSDPRGRWRYSKAYLRRSVAAWKAMKGTP